ncbi:MAG: translational GTPase TypA [Oscillospiraceae bacterium]|nr:translational GTPase TypA [Oscillospiraceae bacterium]
MAQQDKIRNIAIIAHVDHGKTTLVDEMLKQGGIYRENQAVVDRVMDSGDLERERGITILAKNTSVRYKDYKINIVDTPGHADFGGEVERILKMVNGVLLLVDAAEGPMPQTRFVLQKALELGHKVIVVVNKIDRLDARIEEVMDEVLELLLDLDATEEQFDSPTLFCSARQGIASYGPTDIGIDLTPLFETIVNYIPAPTGDCEAPLQMLVSSIDYNEYVGRIGIGRIERGTIRQNQEITICDYHDPEMMEKGKIVALYTFEGLNRTPVQEASAGEIVAFSGISDLTIGRTICAPGEAEPLPFVKISDPTIEMTFSINDSPFAGREGKYVTSRNLRDRLDRELLKDVSLHVTEQGTDAFNVAGRGEMHLSILIETMRREGYEFQVSTPRVLTKVIDGVRCEPVERMVADVPEASMGAVIEKIGQRKGDLVSMTPVGSRYRLEFLVPSRGLFGYRNEFLTDTRGEGIMSSVLDSYCPMKGEIARRSTGSLIAFETGEATAYGIGGVQDRGAMFIAPGAPVYAGMIVGSCNRNEDMAVNVCKKKQLTNMRAAGSDEAVRLVPPRVLSLEQCLEYLADDELLEVTPQNLRMRKQILDHSVRMRQVMKNRQSGK